MNRRLTRKIHFVSDETNQVVSKPRAQFKGLSTLNGVHLEVDPTMGVVLQPEDAGWLTFAKR